jgi:hypothetical protein
MANTIQKAFTNSIVQETIIKNLDAFETVDFIKGIGQVNEFLLHALKSNKDKDFINILLQNTNVSEYSSEVLENLSDDNWKTISLEQHLSEEIIFRFKTRISFNHLFWNTHCGSTITKSEKFNQEFPSFKNLTSCWECFKTIEKNWEKPGLCDACSPKKCPICRLDIDDMDCGIKNGVNFCWKQNLIQRPVFVLPLTDDEDDEYEMTDDE